MAYFLRYKAGNNKELLTKNTGDPIAKAANGHEYVDLGLPSGTLWAKYNVGARIDTDPGLYFAWGDTRGYSEEEIGEGKTKKAFEFEDYKWTIFIDGNPVYSKYNEPNSILDLEDDAARVNMGGEWRIPTEELLMELIDSHYTTSEEVTLGQDSNSPVQITNGIKITSKINNNFIYIPLSGIASRGKIGLSDKNSVIFSSKCTDISKALALVSQLGNSSPIIENTIGKYMGCSVRGVLKIN